jgi:hypothetical protein
VKIRDKREMYDLQRRGLLGNFLPAYSWREFLEQKPRGMFGFRHRTKSGSPLFRRRMSEVEVEEYVRGLLKSGAIVEGDVVVSVDTSLTDEWRTLQGEVMRSLPRVGGGPREALGLTLSYAQLFSEWTCREEMRQSNLTTLHGLEADQMLRRFLDERSYDWMRELTDAYPDAVVEFTSFSHALGVFGWNTIFWEVRDY